MIDEWSSTGAQVPKQISVPVADVPLPMEEMAFLQLRNHDTIDTVDTDDFTVVRTRLYESVRQSEAAWRVEAESKGLEMGIGRYLLVDGR